MKLRYRTLTLLLTLLFLLKSEVVTLSAASAQEKPLVLAFYYAWFDQNTWNSGRSAGLPAEPYNSADRATIERHVSQAQGAGIDAFVQSWYGPQEVNNQTETNFRLLLDVAQTRGFQAAVDFEASGPFFGDSGSVTQALVTLLATHVQHPAYLRYQGKPVIFFWRQQRFSIDQWAAIRGQVDPGYSTYWIAEGVELSYQSVFDGHHLYSMAWSTAPAGEMTQWGQQVRAYESSHQVERLWVATAMPGYDDTRLGRNNSFVIPRGNGDYYRKTWQGALASQPDMIIVNSFNEWLEGSYIEPSAAHGNLYLDITRELVAGLTGSSPAPLATIPAAVQATLEPAIQDLPDGPIIRATDVTNVRSGPAITFDRVGQLPAGSVIAVIGQNEAGDWWQIEFEAGPAGNGWVAAEVVEFVGATGEVPVVEASTSEVEVQTEGETVSTSESSTSQAESESPDEAIDEPIIAGNIEAIEPINVRDTPSLAGILLGGLYPGETANVLAISEDEAWWQIEFSDSPDGTGWVSADFVRFEGERNEVPIFGAGTVTPTPSSTATSTPTLIPVTPTPLRQPTFAPTATSIYQATSAALLENRGTPDPTLTARPSEQRSFFQWADIPWGILSVLVVAGFLWYQFRQRRRRQSG